MKQKGKIWIDENGRSHDAKIINPVLRMEEKYAQQLRTFALRAEKAIKAIDDKMKEAYEALYLAKMNDAKIKGHKP